MAEERTYIPFTSRAKATTFDGILTEAHQIEDLDYGGAPKNQHDINAEVKANLARIEGIAGSAAAGAYVFKGSLNGLADLLLLKNVKVGDVYNIKTEFTLSGGKYPAGTNVAATKAMSASVPDGWDALGGVTLDLAPITQEIEKLKTGKYDASKVVTTSATNDDAHVLTAKATHDVANSAATTAVNTFKTTNFDPLNQQVSKIDTNKADVTYVNQELQKKSDNGHNHNSQYSAIGHNHTVADISDFSAKVDEKITGRVEKLAGNQTTSDTAFYSCKATNEVATSKATEVLNNFKTTDYELFKQQTSTTLADKADAANVYTKAEVNAKIVNNKADKASTDKALSAKATHEAIADALDVVAPDVTDLTTSVENIKKFVTVPFDGYASGSISIESMGTENVAQILYDMKSKSFVAKGTDGKYYNSWRVPDTDGRQRDLYINGMASHPKKLYVYNNEIYTISQLGLSLTIGKNLTTVDGEDNVRGVTQAAIAGKLKNYLTKGETAANYVSKTTYQELVDRVEKLEARLKLA